MNIWVHRFFWTGVSGFLGYNPSSGISRSKGSFIFSFRKKFHSVFQSGRASLHSHQQCTRVPLLHNLATLLFVDLFTMAILTGVKWHFIVEFASLWWQWPNYLDQGSLALSIYLFIFNYVLFILNCTYYLNYFQRSISDIGLSKTTLDLKNYLHFIKNAL